MEAKPLCVRFVRVPSGPREDSVSFKHRLRTLLMCIPLLFGALGGMPMRPEEIEELMRTMNQQKIVMVVEDEGDNRKLPKLPELGP